jgi:hypothetical protein
MFGPNAYRPPSVRLGAPSVGPTEDPVTDKNKQKDDKGKPLPDDQHPKDENGCPFPLPSPIVIVNGL